MGIQNRIILIFVRNRRDAVYHAALNQPSGRSLVGNHYTEEVQIILDRKVTIFLVPVELSTSISGSHTATYVVNAYVPQICVYLR